jgi:hypothetical protein
MSQTATIIIFSAVILAFAIGFAVHIGSRTSIATAPPTASTRPSKAEPMKVYLGMRDLILKANRKEFNTGPVSSPSEPWGVVMDWKVSKAFCTVMAMSDGSASIYLSSGGGFLGGQSHEPIRKAAQRAVLAAAEFQPLATATTTFPLPEPGTVNFYFLTDSGVLAATAPEADLRKHQHPMSKLGDACQNIITEYRLLKP